MNDEVSFGYAVFSDRDVQRILTKNLIAGVNYIVLRTFKPENSSCYSRILHCAT